MPELGSYLCWIPGLRGAPCDPGFSWSPRSGPRLERRRQKERSRVSAAGLSGPPTCLAPRWASLRGCPFFASVPNSETTQTPAEAAGQVGAQIPAGPGRAEGLGAPWGGGSKWAGGSRDCAVVLLPPPSLSHGHRSLFCPSPRPAHQRVSVRRLEVVVFDTCQELFPTKFTGVLLQRPRVFLLFLHVRPQLPPSGKPVLNRPQGLQRVRKEILRSLRPCDFPPILSSRPNPNTVGLS